MEGDGVAEGVPTTAATVALGRELGVPTPLAVAMSHVLERGIGCDEMLGEMLGSEISAE